MKSFIIYFLNELNTMVNVPAFLAAGKSSIDNYFQALELSESHKISLQHL